MNATTGFRAAITALQGGDVSRARLLCDDVLRQDPRHADALRLAGLLACQSGQYERGIEFFTRSLAANPHQAVAHANIGGALVMLRRPQDALSHCDKALAMQPGSAEAHYSRGCALHELQRHEEAIADFDATLRAVPQHVPALLNRGNALHKLERLEEALATFERALALSPNDASALYNRGNVLREMGRCEQALASYDRVLALNLKSVELLNNRGNALRELSRFSEALDAYEQALQLQPESLEPLNNRGMVLMDLGRTKDALACFEQVLRLKPDFAVALDNLGLALRMDDRPDEAIRAYAELVRLAPDFKGALTNLHYARLICCDWSQYSQESAAVIESVRQGKPANPFPVLAVSQDPQLQRECARIFARSEGWLTDLGGLKEAGGKPDRLSGPHAVGPQGPNQQASSPETPGHQARGQETSARDTPSASDFAAVPELETTRGSDSAERQEGSPADTRHRHDRIRVAYVSADFRQHAVSLLLAGVLEQHDRKHFEIFGISLRPEEPNAFGQRIRSAFDTFIDVTHQSDREVADLIRSLKIDIAVDLMGYTRWCRPAIFSQRPAPIQVNYLGYPGGMGVPFIDYLIADEFVIPREMARHYQEQIVYLPDCFQPNDDRRVIGKIPTRAEAGLPESGFVFCSFNNTYKLNPTLFDIWMRLLSQVPGSVLWLVVENQVACENLRREASQRGVDPQRLIFARRMPYEEHLARLSLADLFLDTLPFNAGTTASDALWASVPVLTCPGDAFASRMAGSLLRAIGLPDLFTNTLADYERLALSLAHSPERLHPLRARLASNRHTYPLFHTHDYTRHLEAAYTSMHARHLRGEPPASITVEPIGQR